MKSQTLIITPELQRYANRIARKAGYNKATALIFGDRDCIAHRTRPGYRKHTTGEYVPTAYLRNFGWKNTYYQLAHTVVMLAI